MIHLFEFDDETKTFKISGIRNRPKKKELTCEQEIILSLYNYLDENDKHTVYHYWIKDSLGKNAESVFRELVDESGHD